MIGKQSNQQLNKQTNEHNMIDAQPFDIYGTKLDSRLLIGSALYPSPKVMLESIRNSRAQVVTLSLSRQNPQVSGVSGGQSFWNLIKELGLHLLPNTAGCHSVKEAVTMAQMSRELFQTDWIKLELVGDDFNLQPDPIDLVKATEILLKDGFKVLPYCTDDLVIARHLVELGCKVIMPWGSPIGTGKGILNPYAIQAIRERFPEVTIIIDSGIGAPSHAMQAMEMGIDGVLLNTAVAKARDPNTMAKAFAGAIDAGRLAFEGGLMVERQQASASTPTIDSPFWHHHSSTK